MMLSPIQLKVIVDMSVIKDNRRKSYLIIILHGTETLRNKIPKKQRKLYSLFRSDKERRAIEMKLNQRL